MALPTRGRPSSQTGKGRHKVCCYGTCSSSSAPTLAEETVEFIRFPKPCLHYRNAIPGSAFRRYHKISECKECDRAARWVHRCRRVSGLVHIDNIGPHTYICTKHFFSIENAKSLQEDPHPATGGPMKTRRPPPKQRITMSVDQKANKSDSKTACSSTRLSYDFLVDHRDYCLLTETVPDSSEIDGALIVNVSSTTDDDHSILPKADDVVPGATSGDCDHEDPSEIDWANLGTGFLKDGWVVELSDKKLTLLRRRERFIMLSIVISESLLEVTVFGKIVHLPFYLTSMKMTEENIKMVVSVIEKYRLCEGVNQQDLIDIQKECNDTKGFFCPLTNLCRSYDCSGFIIDESDGNMCYFCQDYYEALSTVLTRITKNNSNEFKKTINYRFLGRQQLQEVIQNKKKTIKSQRSKIIKLEKKISRINQWIQ
ncbi:hypothetical protein CHUAL_000403 [Chamberlinius hualienensis]